MSTTLTARPTPAEDNKLRLADRAVHDWYRFVLAFPPHLVRDYLARFGVEPGQQVLDPFCGTGTTLVECKKRGIASLGLDANPIAQFAARVKTDWQPDPAGLLAHARAVAATAEEHLAADGIEDNPLRPLDSLPALQTLPPAAAALLLKGSISPLPLHKTLVLLDCLDRHADARYADHERLALAKAVVQQASNLRFGPEVGVGPAKADAPVVSAWLAEVRSISEDLAVVPANRAACAQVWAQDARHLPGAIPLQSIDAVITSPPYPNEKDYTRATRLESVLLGFITDRADLRRLKQGLLRSNTRNVYKGDDDGQWIAAFPEIAQLAAQIEARRIELGKTSGFERLYGTVTRLYFGGMARHLAALRPLLRPGAHLAYVVGDQASYFRVPIRTGHLLATIAASLGYTLVSIDLFRTRLSTATGDQLREEVVVLRWPGGTY
ncbi:MAG: site-specific DNA-methyltransferase [Chloroflexota bacterium]|nr:site-specific DNA-methyltransferase [Chloroflexota bacterium]